MYMLYEFYRTFRFLTLLLLFYFMDILKSCLQFRYSVLNLCFIPLYTMKYVSFLYTHTLYYIYIHICVCTCVAISYVKMKKKRALWIRKEKENKE